MDIINKLRPAVSKIYRIPYVGYAARIAVALLKLPRFNFHLRRMEQELSLLRQLVVEMNSAAGSEQVSAIDMPNSNELSEGRDVFLRHVPAFLNAVSSVGAFGFELKNQTKRVDLLIQSLEGRLSEQDARLAECEKRYKALSTSRSLPSPTAKRPVKAD